MPRHRFRVAIIPARIVLHPTRQGRLQHRRRIAGAAGIAIVPVIQQQNRPPRIRAMACARPSESANGSLRYTKPSRCAQIPAAIRSAAASACARSPSATTTTADARVRNIRQPEPRQARTPRRCRALPPPAPRAPPRASRRHRSRTARCASSVAGRRHAIRGGIRRRSSATTAAPHARRISPIHIDVGIRLEADDHVGVLHHPRRRVLPCRSNATAIGTPGAAARIGPADRASPSSLFRPPLRRAGPGKSPRSPAHPRDAGAHLIVGIGVHGAAGIRPGRQRRHHLRAPCAARSMKAPMAVRAPSFSRRASAP